MKKFLLILLCAAAIIAGMLVIWKIVLSLLAAVIGGLLPG